MINNKSAGAFKEMGKSPLNDERDLVISKSASGYVIAQVAYIPDAERPDGKQPIFMKNSMRCDGEKLLAIYDMIGKVLEAEGLLLFDESAE